MNGPKGRTRLSHGGAPARRTGRRAIRRSRARTIGLRRCSPISSARSSTRSRRARKGCRSPLARRSSRRATPRTASSSSRRARARSAAETPRATRSSSRGSGGAVLRRGRDPCRDAKDSDCTCDRRRRAARPELEGVPGDARAVGSRGPQFLRDRQGTDRVHAMSWAATSLPDRAVETTVGRTCVFGRWPRSCSWLPSPVSRWPCRNHREGAPRIAPFEGRTRAWVRRRAV
jgi:hypothetical protein